MPNPPPLTFIGFSPHILAFGAFAVGNTKDWIADQAEIHKKCEHIVYTGQTPNHQTINKHSHNYVDTQKLLTGLTCVVIVL